MTKSMENNKFCSSHPLLDKKHNLTQVEGFAEAAMLLVF
jgi:hypothetical protein